MTKIDQKRSKIDFGHKKRPSNTAESSRDFLKKRQIVYFYPLLHFWGPKSTFRGSWNEVKNDPNFDPKNDPNFGLKNDPNFGCKNNALSDLYFSFLWMLGISILCTFELFHYNPFFQLLHYSPYFKYSKITHKFHTMYIIYTLHFVYTLINF